jgi:predicted dehydrogenase
LKKKKAKVGVIGCGNISGIYFKNSQWLDDLEVVACADLLSERAEAKAREFNIPKSCPVAELLADPEIEIVLNLTIPKAHAEVALAALKAGKHVYGEKPLAVNRAEGQKIMAAAAKARLRVGSAPDTFLGAGIQTCRKLIDDGWIGEPVAATAFMMCHGHEHWHPDPEFYYKVGGGPMLDMGPYYLTALVSLLGPIRRVSGSVRTTFAERLITSQPKYGARIKVDTPTHLAGVFDFASGAVGTIITSFDVWAAELPRIEIYGTAGSLSVPDPNGFGGPVRLFRPGAKQWAEMPLSHIYAENGRGLGVADMAAAIRASRAHRASGELAFHVLDAMLAFEAASRSGRHIELESTCRQPAPLPLGLRHGAVEASA